MDEKRSTQRKPVKRHPANSRLCSLRAVSLEDFQWADQCVRIVDYSIVGMGIESDQPIKAGIVWFNECLYGQKCGHLVWQKQDGDRFRAGIEFLSLSREQESYLRRQVEQVKKGHSIRDPDQLITKMIEGYGDTPENA